MTRRTALLAGVAFVGTILLVPSCGKVPTTPGMSAVSTQAAPGAQASAASETWTRTSVAVDTLAWCECLHEYIHFQGNQSFQYHLVTAGSDSLHILWHAVPTTPATGRQVSATGETSGKVFVGFASPVTHTFNLGAQIQLETLVDRETYEAADGSRLVVTHRIHVTADGTGHLIVQQEEPWSIECSK